MERQKRKLKGIADLYNIEDERLKRQPSPIEDVSQQNISSQDITGKTTSQAPEPTTHIPSQDISEQTISITPIPPAVSTLGEPKISAPQDNPHSYDAPYQDISQEDIFQEDISTENIPEDRTNNRSIVKRDISSQNTSSQNISNSITWSAELVDVGRGYFPLYNDITDRMIREMMLDV